MMNTVARIFSPGARRTARAQAYLQDAYEATFAGRASPEQAEAVLVDLAKVARYYDTAPLDATEGELRDMNGSRRVFHRILLFTKLPPEARDDLAQAVMLENAADAQENSAL